MVYGRCLSLNTRRAARVASRLFDEALRPHGLTSGQFSILVALIGLPEPSVSRLAELLAMDRTTLTANLKPLERAGLVANGRRPGDGRAKLLSITDHGRSVVADALPSWTRTQEVLERRLSSDPGPLVAGLRALTVEPDPADRP